MMWYDVIKIMMWYDVIQYLALTVEVVGCFDKIYPIWVLLNDFGTGT